jgi:hypothetical protein
VFVLWTRDRKRKGGYETITNKTAERVITQGLIYHRNAIPEWAGRLQEGRIYDYSSMF